MQAGSLGSRAFRSRAALPSEWDRRHFGRHQAVQDYLKVDGLNVKYTGPGELDSQAATIFADKAVPQDVPMYYYEVTIVNKGDSGYIGIGFCTDTVNLGRLPGWEPHSYGYHGDDGHAFHGSGQGRPFGPGFTTGDVIGALLDRSRKCISYYKNGEPVGVAFYDVKEQQLYPCVGMRTKHEEIRANFGGAPFCVDLNELHAEFKDRVLADIAALQLPVTVEVPFQPASSSSRSAAAAAATGSGNRDVEAAAAACTQAIRALDSSSSSALAELETATHTYLAALEAAATAGDVGASTAAEVAGGSSVAAPDPFAAAAAAAGAGSRGGKASQPLMLYYVFNYLLHRRCWKTAAIIAREMLAVSTSSGSDASCSDATAAAAAAAAAAGDAPVDMECSTSAQGDQDMPDAGCPSASPAVPATSASTAAAGTSSGGAAAAAAAQGAFSEADVQDALRRQKIYDAVHAGNIADALAIVKVQYGQEVLQQDPRLHFKLRVQQFVELVRSACNASSSVPTTQGQGLVSNGAAAGGSLHAAPGPGNSSGSSSGFEAALAYGRAELGPGSKNEADEELLSDALSLLAYADPAMSPCGHLLRESHRAELAEELNGALLKARGSSGKPLIECCYRQAVVLVDELKRCGLPAALVLDATSLASGSRSSNEGASS